MELGSVKDFFSPKSSLWAHKRLLIAVLVAIFLLWAFIKLNSRRNPQDAPKDITHDGEIWFIGNKSSCVCYGNDLVGGRTSEATEDGSTTRAELDGSTTR